MCVTAPGPAADRRLPISESDLLEHRRDFRSAQLNAETALAVCIVQGNPAGERHSGGHDVNHGAHDDDDDDDRCKLANGEQPDGASEHGSQDAGDADQSLPVPPAQPPGPSGRAMLTFVPCEICSAALHPRRRLKTGSVVAIAAAQRERPDDGSMSRSTRDVPSGAGRAALRGTAHAASVEGCPNGSAFPTR
jgi:hypothetical protein